MREPKRSLVSELGPVHLIGIGGAGMSALAKVLLARGVRVSGSDMKESPDLAALRVQGARIAVGHDAANLGDAETIVVSSAIRPSNPELRAAEEAGVRVLHRAQLLAILMRDRRGIAVAGTHGKTTTTSMIALVLQHAGLDPSFLVGGEVNERGTNAHDGAGEWLVAEADESDGSFLWLAPEIAVVTSIEADHLDHYKDENEVRDTFLAFMENVPPDGAIVACIEDPGVRALVPRLGRRLITYGLNEGDWTAERIPSNGEQTLLVSRAGEDPLELHLPVPGAHNALNALAAVAVASEVGLAFSEIGAALQRYAGVRRRFERRGFAAGVTVVDDYAHNPSKVRAALAAAREQAPRRLVAVFQPHLYSRTMHLGKELGAALAGADVVVVTDVYGAREDPQPGITGKIVVDGVLDAEPRRRVAYLPKRGDIVPYIAERALPGDLVLTIGAGDVAARILTERAHGRVERNGSIAPLTSYRLGGPADVMLEAAGVEDLEALAAAIKETGVPVLVVGRGSNMLVSDRGFDGVALRLGAGFRWSNASGTTIEAGGAMPLPALATLAMHHELAGFEFAVAIPASLGGAVRMNAGAHGHEIAEVLSSVDVFVLPDGTRRRLSAEKAGFSYRRSDLPAGSIVTAASLTLRRGTTEAIVAGMNEAKEWRRRTQPLNLPNGGSVFKNPPGDHAARLIEQVCGKQMRVGGARISEVHANFIVAEDDARADDVYTLLRRIQRMVREDTGVELEPELKLIGEFEEVPDGSHRG